MRAEAVTRALGGRWHGGYGTARCPSHDDRMPSLSIKDGEGGRLLLFCHAGCAFPDLLTAVQALAAGFNQPVIGSECTHGLRRETSRSLQRLVTRIWSKAVTIEGTHAERYLRARGIVGPLSQTLRFHASLRHPGGEWLPAMVARVDDLDGRHVALHRTFLDSKEPRKTNRSPAKAMLGPCKGAAVRLRTGTIALAVTEGIETALSVGMGLDKGVAVWAALSAPGMRRICLPDPHPFGGVLLIATDGDHAGRTAGETLADRASALGWRVEIVSAPEGVDFNDLARQARHG